MNLEIVILFVGAALFALLILAIAKAENPDDGWLRFLSIGCAPPEWSGELRLDVRSAFKEAMRFLDSSSSENA